MTPAQHIDARIAELADWRGTLLAKLRAIIQRADPHVVEAWKWRGVPTWCHDGIITTGETYKAVVKLTFMNGAALADPAKLFNSSLAGSTRRAIDFHEGDEVDAAALAALVREAVALNASKTKPRSASRTSPSAKPSAAARGGTEAKAKATSKPTSRRRAA